MIHGDGIAETTALLQAHAIGAASLVHVDAGAYVTASSSYPHPRLAEDAAPAAPR